MSLIVYHDSIWKLALCQIVYILNSYWSDPWCLFFVFFIGTLLSKVSSGASFFNILLLSLAREDVDLIFYI